LQQHLSSNPQLVSGLLQSVSLSQAHRGNSRLLADELLFANSGIPQRVIDTWLGHRSDKSMVAVFCRLSDEDSQRFMQKVAFSRFPSDSPTPDQGGKPS
jgi:hypothetical protein